MAIKDPITITSAAAERIKFLLAQRGKPSLGIRILIQTKGCSGLKYKIEYADEANKYDLEVNQHDVKVLIDSKAMLFIIGSIMDYEEAELSSGFVFTNPNEKGKCGCGESFHV
jgi:iron-sulfur cluster assembly protein